jgi:hypothetical protein
MEGTAADVVGRSHLRGSPPARTRDKRMESKDSRDMVCKPRLATHILLMAANTYMPRGLTLSK